MVCNDAFQINDRSRGAAVRMLDVLVLARPRLLETGGRRGYAHCQFVIMYASISGKIEACSKRKLKIC